jgi:hypothetical protein
MEQAKTILAGVAGATLEARATTEGGLALRKLGEVRGDANCGSLKDEWERGSLARHTGGSGTVIDAMRSEVSSSGRKYTCKGPKVPDSEIQSRQGVSRVAPLDAIWRFNLPAAEKPLQMQRPTGGQSAT